MLNDNACTLAVPAVCAAYRKPQCPVSICSAVVPIICSAHELSCCNAGTAASDREKALQQSLLKHVLKDTAAEAYPQLLVDAAAVLISAAMPSHDKPSMSQTNWLQEGDDDLQQQLEDLARGKSAPPCKAPRLGMR